MPRDAYFSPYAIGGLSGYCHGQDLFSKLVFGRPLDGKLVFYSSLFQAGIDRVVVVDQEFQQTGPEEIPQNRLHVVPFENSSVLRESLRHYFDHYLPTDWFRKSEYEGALKLWAFLGDLLTSFHLRRPLLTTLSLPDLAPLQVTLPLEIISPVQTLFQSMQPYESVVAIPTFQINKDRVEVVDEIMASAPYQRLEEIHTQLLEEPSSVESCLATLEEASQELHWRWKDFLRLKSAVIRVGRHIPDLIEAFAGKGPASVAKPIAAVLEEALRREHGILIYDATPLLEESMTNLALQLVRGPKPDTKEIERRIEEFRLEKTERERAGKQE